MVRSLIVVLVALLIVSVSGVCADVPSRKQHLATIRQESGSKAHPNGYIWAIGDMTKVVVVTLPNGKRVKKVVPRPPSEWAYGDYQIRQVYCDDVNRRYGTHFEAKKCLGDHALSERIYDLYMGIYLTKEHLKRTPTDDDASGIHNGGPNGARAGRTAKYREEVRAIRESLK